MATFTDPDGNSVPSDFLAAIDRGDGISTPSTTVTQPGPGPFDVLGTHTYRAAGTYTFSVQFIDTKSCKETTTGTGTVSSRPAGPGKATNSTPCGSILRQHPMACDVREPLTRSQRATPAEASRGESGDALLPNEADLMDYREPLKAGIA